MLIQIHGFVSTKTSFSSIASKKSVGKITKSEIRQQGFKCLASGTVDCYCYCCCCCDINSFGWMHVSFCGECKLAWIAHFAEATTRMRTRTSMSASKRAWNLNGEKRKC